jgi:hypothetical protein
MQEGVDGLLRDKTRPPGRAPLDAEIINGLYKAEVIRVGDGC